MIKRRLELFCDRCAVQIIVPYNENYIREVFDMGTFGYGIHKTRIAILCNDCKKEFRTWFNQGKKISLLRKKEEEY